MPRATLPHHPQRDSATALLRRLRHMRRDAQPVGQDGAEDNGGVRSDPSSIDPARAKSEQNELYRNDRRTPNVIFKEGFQPRGTDDNLLQHVTGGKAAANSGYVSFSKAAKAALRPWSAVESYIYTVRAQKNGVDVVAALAGKPIIEEEQEIAVFGGVPASDVLEAQQYDQLDPVGPPIKNPDARG